MKQNVVMTVTGLRITEQRQAQVGQAVLIAMAHQGVEMDGVAIKFHEADF